MSKDKTSVDEILGNLLSLGEMYSLEDLDSAKQALYELLDKELPPERKLDNVSGKSYHNGYNACRAELRQTLKQLFNIEEK